MTQWIYKATEARIGQGETHNLAMNRNFLCRAAFETNGKQAHADHVRDVAIGDVIHFYYKRRDGKVPDFGSFIVIDGAEYPKRFGERIEGTALFRVRETPENAEMVALLTEEHDRDPTRGYVRHPKHGCFTGWVIRKLPSTEMKPPKFIQAKLLPGPNTTLWRYPDPDLLDR